MTVKPGSVRVRAYNVGFGDCFLLTFKYPNSAKHTDEERHVLIDFGTTGLPPSAPENHMLRVARAIRKTCGGDKGKLQIVIATHRHKDHISGFSTDGDGAGLIIRTLDPEMVIQPWTEDPKARRNATKPATLKALADSVSQYPAAAHIALLDHLHAVSGSIAAEAQHLSNGKSLGQKLGPAISNGISFLGATNASPNESAVKNLAEMGKERHYVYHGYKLDLSRVLPGVNVHVLGPPTIEQHAAIKKQRAKDKNEFWMLRAAAGEFWALQASTGKLVKNLISGGAELFGDAEFFKESIPASSRWFVRRITATRGEQLLGLVRILDKEMNNTSVILLFEVGKKGLLFPGDAQIENWEYALGNAEDRKALKSVHLYKVGHHGSRNATPKTLWGLFETKLAQDKAHDHDRLNTIVSTMPGKHGDKEMNTEVPRTTLVAELEKWSKYQTTETAAKNNELYVETTLDL